MRHRAVLELARVFLAVCLTLVIFFATSLANAQAPTVADSPEDQLKKELDKYPGLMDEIGRLVTKIQQEVQMPPDRPQSALLPLLPVSTSIYAALPNYGEASHQILKVFQQQLPQSPVIRSW